MSDLVTAPDSMRELFAAFDHQVRLALRFISVWGGQEVRVQKLPRDDLPGVWPKAADFAKKWALDRRFEPKMDERQRKTKIKGWKDAVRRTLTTS